MNNLFRTRPAQVEHVVALFDKDTATYLVQSSTREGKGSGAIRQLSQQEFEAQYEPVIRKPRGAKSPTEAGTVTTPTPKAAPEPAKHK